MTPPTDLLPPNPELGEVAFAAGRAWRFTLGGWVHYPLTAMGSRAEWLALGLRLDTAFRRNLVTAENVTRALAAGGIAALRRYLASGHLDGRRVARVMQGARLNVTNRLDRRTVEAWRGGADRYGTIIANRIERAVDEASSVTFLQLRTWVQQAGQQAVWNGHDAEAAAVATLAEAEFKTWVRAWPRTRHRDHHDRLEGITIPIDADFVMPGGPNSGRRVSAPRAWDDVSDPAEWMNCGHALRFERQVTREMAEPALRNRGVLYDPRPRPRPAN